MSIEGTGALNGRIALITGASRGIGRAVAARFAQEGAQLILLARTVGALEELDDQIRAAGGCAPVLVPHDLRKQEELDQLGASLHQRFGKLDILVGNAGELGALSPVGHIAPKTWDQVMSVNLNANYRLIRSLDPLLRLSDAGRAIFVTAEAGHLPQAYWGAYAVAKAGLEMLVRCYAAELQKTQVRANLICPFPSATNLRAKAFPGEDPKKLKAPEELTQVFVDLAGPGCQENGAIVPA